MCWEWDGGLLAIHMTGEVSVLNANSTGRDREKEINIGNQDKT